MMMGFRWPQSDTLRRGHIEVRMAAAVLWRTPALALLRPLALATTAAAAPALNGKLRQAEGDRTEL